MNSHITLFLMAEYKDARKASIFLAPKDYDENKKTILFSSGSSIFKGIIKGANNFAKFSDEYNILLVGLPLKEGYLDDLDENIIYLGYIDWMSHLLTYIDLAVLTDDGVLLEETLASKLPIVTLTKVKWGRYHNMAGVFKGAIIESDIDSLNDNIFRAFDEFDELKKNAVKYAKESLETKSNLAQKIVEGCISKKSPYSSNGEFIRIKYDKYATSLTEDGEMEFIFLILFCFLSKDIFV